LEICPTGKCPCLVTPKGTIFETSAICRYLARLYPEKHFYGADEFEGKI
jgi:glutathione S-transferase